MAKRYSELVYAGELADNGRSGRAYAGNDRAVLMALGIGSSFSAVVIFSLYVHSQEVLALYRMPANLLLLCPLVLYWLSRIWLKAHRGDLHEDPITFAMRDPVSYIVAAISMAIIAGSMVRLG
jgi:4-hydroxybenzoate polyprenyltransferase